MRGFAFAFFHSFLPCVLAEEVAWHSRRYLLRDGPCRPGGVQAGVVARRRWNATHLESPRVGPAAPAAFARDDIRKRTNNKDDLASFGQFVANEVLRVLRTPLGAASWWLRLVKFDSLGPPLLTSYANSAKRASSGSLGLCSSSASERLRRGYARFAPLFNIVAKPEARASFLKSSREVRNPLGVSDHLSFSDGKAPRPTAVDCLPCPRMGLFLRFPMSIFEKLSIYQRSLASFGNFAASSAPFVNACGAPVRTPPHHDNSTFRPPVDRCLFRTALPIACRYSLP
jgi:hypothetical protein